MTNNQIKRNKHSQNILSQNYTQPYSYHTEFSSDFSLDMLRKLFWSLVLSVLVLDNLEASLLSILLLVSEQNAESGRTGLLVTCEQRVTSLDDERNGSG